jgi:hypothetical protein
MSFTSDAPGHPTPREKPSALRRDILKAIGGDVATKAYVDAADAVLAASIAAIPPAPVTFVASRKVSDTSRSSTTTLAVDPTLQVSVNAGARYTIRGSILFTTSVAGGFKWSIDGPTGTITVARRAILPGASAFSGVAIDSAYTAAQTLVVGATTEGSITFELQILVGGSPGNIGFWWAQGVSDAGSTKVLAGSYLEVL